MENIYSPILLPAFLRRLSPAATPPLAKIPMVAFAAIRSGMERGVFYHEPPDFCFLFDL